jgi:hypothetical protein
MGQRLKSPRILTTFPMHPEPFPRSLAVLLQRDVPVYIPSFNNPTYVLGMVAQLRARNVARIIVVDNASTSSAMHALLDTDFGATVVRLEQNFGPHHIFMDNGNFSLLPQIFCITDPDLEFNQQLPIDFISQLAGLTEKLKVGKAGFSLEIERTEMMRDETFTINGRNYKVWEWEQRYWMDQAGELENVGPIYRANIDTTFAVYNKKYFRRENHSDAVRVAGRFTCRHLPWYCDRGISSEEEETYRQTQKYSYYLA